MSIRGDAADRGRKQSFTALFTENWLPVREHVTSALQDDDDVLDEVDELVNEVFLLAWRKWDHPERVTLRWLKVVADNKLRDRRRRQQTRARLMAAIELSLIPGALLWDELDRIAVRRAFSALKDREQRALVLHVRGRLERRGDREATGDDAVGCGSDAQQGEREAP